MRQIEYILDSVEVLADAMDPFVNKATTPKRKGNRYYEKRRLQGTTTINEGDAGLLLATPPGPPGTPDDQ